MPHQPLSAFHEQLLLFLQEDLQRKKNQEGWDESFDPEMRVFSDALSRAIRTSGPLQLQEIVEKHQRLFNERGPVHLEQKLLAAFPDLRMYRGLPRLYRKDQPAISKIKSSFSHLQELKRTTAAKSIYALYEKMEIPKDAKIALMSYVMADGLGDYYAAVESFNLIKKTFPLLEIRLVTISEKELFGSEGQIRFLRGCDLILQMPTYYPSSKELKKKVEEIEDPRPLPKWEFLGQYGFLESDWFHPGSFAHSMGLHFLEKGILVRQASPSSPSQLENVALTEWLFQQTTPGPQEIELYRRDHRFFLAYLFSTVGIYVYLHALLKSLEWDNKDIDICIPDAAKAIAYFSERLQSGKSPLDKHYKVKRLVLHIGSSVANLDLEETGKTLRILCPDQLSAEDFQRLLAFSEDFVACRGDQSFSEVVSRNKGFFYDPRDHSRYFVKDLIALAENRIAPHRSTLGILRLFAKLLEHNLPEEEGEWVDEISIQREGLMNLLEMAETIGLYLQDPDALAGFKKLNKILAEEHSCNGFLLQIVQRAICHRRNPQLAWVEEEEFSRFLYGRQSFAALMGRLSKALL